MARRHAWLMILAAALVLVPLLAGCGSATQTAVPTAVPSKPAATVPPAATAVPATKAPPTAVPATATAQGPTVGGTIVYALNTEPDTLDIHKSSMAVMSMVMSEVNGTLIALDPVDGGFVPYLAESWKFSADGQTLDFKLKSGIKFHDGTPLTAADYAWTFNRALDPETKASLAVTLLGSVASVEAVDGLTLRLNLKEPFYPLLMNLTSSGYMSPLPKAAMEKSAEALARAPIGVGPHKFKEWITGERIVVDRNPDFKWGPAFAKGGPYIQTIEFRVVGEYATAIAGVEAGDIDVYPYLQAKDVDRLKTAGATIISAVLRGGDPLLIINVTKPPFDDLRVRKAVNLAVDRQALVKVLTLGTGVETHVPMSPTTGGYSAALEKIGYGFDQAQAKDLLKQAGYTLGGDGMFAKDGQALKFTLSSGSDESTVKLCEMLKEQYKACGIAVDILVKESGTHRGDLYKGNFQVGTFGYMAPDADILVFGMGSNAIAGADLSKAQDAELDKLLLATRTTLDPVKRQQAVDAAVTYCIEKAYTVPLFSREAYGALSKRLKGAVFSGYTDGIYLFDAYVTK